MKRAIRPAGLALLALVLSAAAPAPDVRAAPAWTVPHGDASRSNDPVPSALRGAPGDQVWGSGVAFDGVNYLVVWTDYRAGDPKVYGARVSPGGTVLDQDGFAISAPGGSGPAVAFDGTNYLVVWSNQESIVGARVDPGGTVLDPGGIPISTRPEPELYPTLAFDGTNYLVAWITMAEDTQTEDVYGARVSPSGTVLDPAGIEIAVRGGFNETSPSVAFDGTNYLVVWQEIPCNRILGRRVSQAGVPDGDGSFLISDCYEDPGNVWIRKFDPAVAFDGVNYLVTWVDFYGNLAGYALNISVARVTPAGTVLDPNGIGITGGGWYGNRGWPSLAFGGSTYLVVWIDGGVVRGARLTRDGSVLDPGGFAMSSSGARFPVNAFDGTNYLAVWDNSVDVLGTRVTQAGGVLDGNGFQITRNGPPPPPPPPPRLRHHRLRHLLRLLLHLLLHHHHLLRHHHHRHHRHRHRRHHLRADAACHASSACAFQAQGRGFGRGTAGSEQFAGPALGASAASSGRAPGAVRSARGTSGST